MELAELRRPSILTSIRSRRVVDMGTKISDIIETIILVACLPYLMACLHLHSCSHNGLVPISILRPIARRWLGWCDDLRYLYYHRLLYHRFAHSLDKSQTVSIESGLLIRLFKFGSLFCLLPADRREISDMHF